MALDILAVLNSMLTKCQLPRKSQSNCFVMTLFGIEVVVGVQGFVIRQERVSYNGWFSSISDWGLVFGSLHLVNWIVQYVITAQAICEWDGGECSCPCSYIAQLQTGSGFSPPQTK